MQVKTALPGIEVDFVALTPLEDDSFGLNFTLISDLDDPALADDLQNDGRDYFSNWDNFTEAVPPGIYTNSSSFEVKGKLQ